MSESFEEKVSDLVADLTRQRDAAWLQTENQKTRIGELLTALEKLHRERDEAREAAAKWESLFSTMERAGAEQARRADTNREWGLRAERERDEAREALKKIKHIYIDGGDTYLDFVRVGNIATDYLEGL